MNNTVEIIIYTQTNALSHVIISPVKDLQEIIDEAFADNQALVFDTADGTRLLINTFNIVAIEIK